MLPIEFLIMKVIRADVLGFCMGVRRAVETAQSIIAEKKGCKDSKPSVFSMGPLIHNPIVLKELKEQGVGILNESDIDCMPEESVVVIRAHGIPPVVYERLHEKKAIIKDATCPRVKASQNCAQKFSQDGYTIILAGDKGHGEVLGIAGFAGSNFILIQNRNEAERLFEKEIESALPLPEKVILLAQTTFNPVEYESISTILKEKIPSIKIFKTICSATQERQDALVKLCAEVDGVLVVGGKTSANTQRLFSKAKGLCAHAALIEKASEIPDEFYSLKTVGITAGASTPSEVIEDVEKALQKTDLK